MEKKSTVQFHGCGQYGIPRVDPMGTIQLLCVRKPKKDTSEILFAVVAGLVKNEA